MNMKWLKIVGKSTVILGALTVGAFASQSAFMQVGVGYSYVQ